MIIFQMINFARCKAQPLRSGMVGRPCLNVYIERVYVLREYYFNWTQIANTMDIHRSTLLRKLKKCGYNFEEKCSTISPEELNREIIAMKEKHPLIGEKMVIRFLRSKGLPVQRRRVWDSIHTVDRFNGINKCLQKNPRWVYSVPGPNSLWHNDGLHKLIHWGIVIHACIDGFSRMIVSVLCATNNYADTCLTGFLSGVKEYGLPARVRGDKGAENNSILKYMQQRQGCKGAYIQGPSVHNQRIEGLHYDTTHCVLSHFIGIFCTWKNMSY